MKTLFLEAIRWVNLPYTLIVGLMGMYWITVILGFLDIDIFDFDLDVDVDLDIDAIGMNSILGILNVGSVPFSIWLSIFAFQMWAYSIIFNVVLDGIPVFQLPGILRFAICALICIPIAATITKVATTPLKKLFDQKTVTKHDFVGKECLVTSSQVNGQFGTAEIRISGTPQLIDIRAKPEDGLKKDDKALIYDYDAEQDVFYVTNT